MPTSVDIKNLKINKLTEAQYDTAVQGGVIGENELSILTDVEAGQVIQVDTMPTASATEEGKIYQYIGATDANYTNGYFYKCVSDGQNPATYSWTQVDVQPVVNPLPSQTGQSGKFLTTDGTDASWSDKPLVNNSTGTSSLVILGSDNPFALSTNGVVALGGSASSFSDYSISIGSTASVGISSSYGISIGYNCAANAQYAIQIGSRGVLSSINTDANTFKVANANGNFELMSADGTIPKERLANVISMPATMPELTVAGWSNNTQTVNVTGVTANNVVFVSPAPLSTTEYAQCGVACIAQAAGTLTFTCTTVPENALTVNVVCL